MKNNSYSKILGLVLHTSAENELSCNSCGEECLDACGTRYFR